MQTHQQHGPLWHPKIDSWEIPLPIRTIQRGAAARESANHLNPLQTLAHDVICLLLTRTTSPKRSERCNGFARHLDIGNGIPIEIERFTLVPEVHVDPSFAPVFPSEPLVHCLYAAENALDTW